MATSTRPAQETPVDWQAIEASPEFQELIRRKRTYVLPRTIFFLAWYFGFILLAGYAPDFMGERIYQGFTVGYALALTQFVMVWYLAVSYLHKADRDFDPLEQAAVRHLDGAADGDRVTDGRFAPTGTPAQVPTTERVG
jgi:uncharacterized membrane protein (DUF485 family)